MFTERINIKEKQLLLNQISRGLGSWGLIENTVSVIFFALLHIPSPNRLLDCFFDCFFSISRAAMEASGQSEPLAGAEIHGFQNVAGVCHVLPFRGLLVFLFVFVRIFDSIFLMSSSTCA
jgi:membrane protease YdiL (CAAX protease family)